MLRAAVTAVPDAVLVFIYPLKVLIPLGIALLFASTSLLVPNVIKPLIFSALTRKPSTSRVAAEVGFLMAN